MNEFAFHTPTEIVFGKGAEAKTSALIQKYGGSRVLIVYGGGSAVRSGLLGQIENQLKQDRIEYRLHGGVKPNPIASHIREGIKAALDFQADFILAVGGGSAIDEAKAIAHGAKTPQTDFLAFWTGEAELTASLPVGTVLTIAAAGSETSASAVITNDETEQKRGLGSPHNRPCFAVMNPEWTFTLPKAQIACGIVDIMMHTLERYFTPVDGNRMTDEIAEGLLRVTIDSGRVALNNPSDYDAMSELMWCGSLSHSGLTGLGRPIDFSVHQMGHELGARFDVSHGASLSALWGSWAELCRPEDIKRFARYAQSVWGISCLDVGEAARAGIEQTVEYFKELRMPTCFTELGIGVLPEEDILKLAESCTFHGKRKIGQLMPLDAEGIAKVYRMANR
ncbi:MAG: iron-containing alcohol dehydrogenase [Oscillospiraceae bacterium]|jgi:alcohol dehydrogenase YqhD (iron-dependent ADH family)|nr:iron-containing alcohol dehydrogenase [Oscillospiraceae bacterium]